MRKVKHIGPDVQKRYTYHELPIGDTGIGLPAERRKTGLWRYLKPVFEYKIPPCQDACPLGNWIQKFVLELSEGNLNEALWALMLENPFPSVCGRVCHHPCERFCNRKELDGAISIQAIERYLGDLFLEKQVEARLLRKKQGKRVAIIGSGPAGLACAYFLTLLGYDITIFEASNELGGTPQIGIPAYRLPREVLNREIQNILSLGVNVRLGCKVGKDIEFSELLKFDAVFIASGAQREPLLNVPDEKLKGVYRSIDFLNRVRLRKSIHLSKKVLVIGGGNVAIDVACTSLRMGVKNVSLVCLEKRDEMPAWDYEIEDALEEGVNIINEYGVKRFLQKEGRLNGVEFKRCIAVFDEQGSFNPQFDESDRMTMKADTVIVAIGRHADLNFVEGKSISVSRKRLIEVDPITFETSIKGVFAGGDVIDQPWNISTAISSAKKAAVAMDHYLMGRNLREVATQGSLALTMREHLGIDEEATRNGAKVANFEDLNLAYVVFSPKHIPKRLHPVERIRNFKEITLGIDLFEATKEAERCLSCGVCRMCGNCYLFCPDGTIQLDPEKNRYVIDYDYCKGCGVCENECRTGAITIKTEGEV